MKYQITVYHGGEYPTETFNHMDKKICNLIRQNYKVWQNKTDDFIINYCGFYPKIVYLISNKGFPLNKNIFNYANN